MRKRMVERIAGHVGMNIILRAILTISRLTRIILWVHAKTRQPHTRIRFMYRTRARATVLVTLSGQLDQELLVPMDHCKLKQTDR